MFLGKIVHSYLYKYLHCAVSGLRSSSFFADLSFPKENSLVNVTRDAMVGCVRPRMINYFDLRVFMYVYIYKKILGTLSERVKEQLRAKYIEKNREVKRSIKADKKK